MGSVNLVVDIGNTRVKVGVFTDGNLIFNTIYETLTEKNLQNCITTHNITHAIISSVKDVSENIENVLRQNTFYHPFGLNSKIPFNNKYASPETLGKDRVAVIAAVAKEYVGCAVLVIDLGTCITYDIIDEDKNYFGGAISPGLTMRFDALHDYTRKLPAIEWDGADIDFIGNSTENSIKSGVINGIKNELQGAINHYLKKYPELKIVLTGGNAKMFDLEPKNRIFADDFLVLKGLNEILIGNAKN